MTQFLPAIAGVGQARDRTNDPAVAPDPVGLMAQAVHQALRDAGLGTQALTYVDRIEAIDVLSWRYDGGPARALAERLGISDSASTWDSPVGGEQPIARIDALCARIASGEIDFAIVAGGEAQAAVNASRRLEIALAWPEKPVRTRGQSTIAEIVHPEAWRHGLRLPVTVYPLFENALRAARGLGFTEAQRKSARSWALMSAIAAGNPLAWSANEMLPDDIGRPSARNRWISYPYPKLMTANSSVNFGSAVILMAADRARSLEVDPRRLVYPVAAAGARELADPISRPRFDRSLAMEVVLDTVRERAELSTSDFDAIELYSCFPVVPDAAATYLGVSGTDPLTVTGGLTFFGGPGNSYMLHAVAAMADRLRGSTASGLLYGQGEFMTKHHALAVSGAPPARGYRHGVGALPQQAGISKDAYGTVATQPAGNAHVETFTVAFDGNGAHPTGIVVGRLDDQTRFAAHVPTEDASGIARLMAEETPIGARGRVEPGEARNIFRFVPL